MNSVVLAGNLTADPEIRTTSNGNTQCTFRIACQRRFKNSQTGEREADFISCVAWRQTAEFVAKYFHKGSKMVLQGEIRSRTYQTETGEKRYVTEVAVDNVEFAGSKNDGGGGYQKQSFPKDDYYPANTGMGNKKPPQTGDVFAGDEEPWEPLDDSDLPF